MNETIEPRTASGKAQARGLDPVIRHEQAHSHDANVNGTLSGNLKTESDVRLHLFPKREGEVGKPRRALVWIPLAVLVCLGLIGIIEVAFPDPPETTNATINRITALHGRDTAGQASVILRMPAAQAKGLRVGQGVRIQ